jgi:general secretion pathway protein I
MRGSCVTAAADPELPEAGFTLVEVIVALAMLSVGLTVLLGIISSSLSRTGIAERTAEAASLAQSLLAQAGTELAIGAGERDGVFPHDYRWHLTMRPYPSPHQAPERAIALYQVTAQVGWGEGAEQRSFVLSTLRFGPRTVRP